MDVGRYIDQLSDGVERDGRIVMGAQAQAQVAVKPALSTATTPFLMRLVWEVHSG